jgi:hypothetical protein
LFRLRFLVTPGKKGAIKKVPGEIFKIESTCTAKIGTKETGKEER